MRVSTAAPSAQASCLLRLHSLNHLALPGNEVQQDIMVPIVLTCLCRVR
jgi:hypothetical protein